MHPISEGSSSTSRPSGIDRNPRAEHVQSHADRTPRLVGDSASMSALRDVVATIGQRRCTVMILGETGTGKELLARHLHASSGRADRPFIPVDCSSLSETLFESELFGHTRGAFTGAARDTLGFIRAADGGTLFLDEIGELPLGIQAKLLRVIQEREVVPVGSVKPIPVDLRIVCATHRDLPRMVREGSFREDLYFRLNVVVMHAPPLRERPDDVAKLARHFLSLQGQLYDEPVKRLSPDAEAALQGYNWPGNVRELANVMEHAHVLASGPTVEPTDLPERLRNPTGGDLPVSDLRLADVERKTIAEALRRTGHNKSAAARLLGIGVQKLTRRLIKLEIGSHGHASRCDKSPRI